MKNKKLIRTNILVSIILIIGFVLTAMFSYQANYKSSLNNIEQVSSLSAGEIYYQMTMMFSKPVNVSLTMANDRFLVEHLMTEPSTADEGYIETTKKYLDEYRKKYGFDSVFLVSTTTNNYYNFNGLDRELKRGDPENQWYYNLLDSDEEYFLVVDNDEVNGADNAITVFVNCKVEGPHDELLGVVGVGIRIDYLKEMLKSYEKNYNLKASLIDREGFIDISTTYTGYEHKNWFEVYEQQSLKETVLEWEKNTSNLEIWAPPNPRTNERSYVVTRYIPELQWHLVVEQNTGHLISEMKQRLYLTGLLILAVIIVVLTVITIVIRNFNKQITELIEEKQVMFRRATEQLYDNIYELNITKNCYVGERTEKYFESLGAKGVPFDKGLHVIAEKQIKEEYQEGYLQMFTPQNVIREFEQGNNHLRYDFMMMREDGNYHWMRIDAYIFYFPEEDSIHMFTYRKNIDEEKQREQKADTDEMTGLYAKKTTERMIEKLLMEDPQNDYAFFIFDIDNFKQVNDGFGHAFGDFCIQAFAEIIKKHFSSYDLIGRIGGDEFVAFAVAPNRKWVEEKVKELNRALDTTCKDGLYQWKMSASIGVAIYPEAGTDFDAIYKNADSALYQTKRNGKNGYTIF